MEGTTLPIVSNGTKELVQVNKRVVFGRVKLRNAGFAKVLELDLAAHKLAHVILKGFGAESNFR